MDNHKRRCTLCGKEAFLIEEFYQGYMEGNFYKIYLCEHCNTSFSIANGDEVDIYDIIYQFAEKLPGYDRYYRYYNAIKSEKKPLEYLAKSEETYWIVKDSLSKIEKEKSEIKIIEIGSGLGYLTYALNKEGYNAQGIEISCNAVKKATQQFGYHYTCADIYDYFKKAPKQYDVAILTEVIEHVENPIEFLRVVRSVLKDGGKMIITTPNKTIFSQNEVWRTDLPPVHLWWFSKKSMLYIGNLLDMKTAFTDFTNYYKKKTVFVTLKPHEKQPKPILNSEGLLMTSPPLKGIRLYIHSIKSALEKIKICYTIVKKIKYGRYIYKCNKEGGFLGIIFEKN